MYAYLRPLVVQEQSLSSSLSLSLGRGGDAPKYQTSKGTYGGFVGKSQDVCNIFGEY